MQQTSQRSFALMSIKDEACAPLDGGKASQETSFAHLTKKKLEYVQLTDKRQTGGFDEPTNNSAKLVKPTWGARQDILY